MKNLSLIVWLIQLGLSVAVPPVALIWLTVWLHNAYNWGRWVIWIGAGLGVFLAIDGLRASLKVMERMSARKNEEQPPISFNEHD